ncbi:MAG: hypothetical protein KDA79_05395 [Planctomycetaceae bacterium]|nr:hypothetical protein [Planctomycetaceae bacterium]
MLAAKLKDLLQCDCWLMRLDVIISETDSRRLNQGNAWNWNLIGDRRAAIHQEDVMLFRQTTCQQGHPHEMACTNQTEAVNQDFSHAVTLISRQYQRAVAMLKTADHTAGEQADSCPRTQTLSHYSRDEVLFESIPCSQSS